MAESKLTIKVAADVSKAVSGIESVNQKLQDMSKAASLSTSALSRISSTLGGLSIVYSSAKNVISFFTDKVKAAAEAYSIQEQAQTRLETALKATNNAIGMSATELYELASSFQDVTTYGDEAIIEVEKLFVASGKISKQAMPKAIEATLDMASAMGEDLNSAAKRLAKTLADPKSNLDALKDANIQLSEAQKNEIKSLQEANNLYGAQSIVLRSVAESYGGIATALADTDTGKLTQIENVWGDIKEGLGKSLLDKISPALDTLYTSLKKIYDFIDSRNDNRDVLNTASAINSGNWKGNIADLTQEEIETTLATNKYYQWKRDYKRNYSFNLDDYDENFAAATARGIKVGEISQEDIALVEELEKRLAEIYAQVAKIRREEESVANSANSYQDLAYEKGLIMSSLADAEAEALALEEERQKAAEEANKSAVEEYISKNKSLSVTAQILDIEKQITEARELQINASEDEAKIIEESIEALEKKKKTLLGITDVDPEQERLSKISSVISSNRGLSKTAQVASIDSQIAEAYSALSLTGGEGTTEYQSIVEIIQGLKEQKNALEDVAEAGDDVADTFNTINDYAQEIGSAVVNFASQVATLIDTIYDNQISAIESLLDESETKWDKYLDKLEDKQDLQKDSLAHLYDEGLISLEDYNNATQQMYEDKVAAEEEAEAEQEKLKKRKNELEEKQFNANKAVSIAEALINGALAITDIWAEHAANPVLAGVLTGLSAATTAASIATISASKFTPMAVGGIVTKPTYALLGEGGAKEAVLPLTETNMKRSGFGSSGSEGTINISINIGTAYNGEQLSRDIFNGIEKAQRTGLLPNWRYA